MTTAIRSEATRSVVVVNGVDTMSINQDGSVELLNASYTSSGHVPMVRSSAATALSGTSVVFEDIPTWVNKIIIHFSGMSVSGTSIPQIQIGSGSYDVSGYLGSTSDGLPAGTTAALHNTGALLGSLGNAAYTKHGSVTLSRTPDNTWFISGVLGNSDTARASMIGGSKPLSGPLDRVRITTVNGTDNFDSGSVYLTYEG